MQKLFIPEKLKVGFQKRTGTYTGKLAYVIYYDQKGKLRKETSWQNWRNHEIDVLDTINEPTEGFVLNKGVGGVKQSYGWNPRNEYIRVYDPRDFEFEVSLPNLLFILRECDCSRGKGLEGKFVYSWDGTELVLLPVNSQDYQNSIEFTDLKLQGVKGRELVKGSTYTTKDMTKLCYIDRFEYHFMVQGTDGYWGYREKRDKKGFCKKYVFWNPQEESFVLMDTPKQIAKLVSSSEMPEYAEVVQQYYESPFGSKVKKLISKPQENVKDNWFFKEDDIYYTCTTEFNWNNEGTDKDKVRAVV